MIFRISVIKYIINKIKSWFTRNQDKDEHLVLYENMNYLTIPDKPSNRVITETVVYSDNSRKEIYCGACGAIA